MRSFPSLWGLAAFGLMALALAGLAGAAPTGAIAFELSPTLTEQAVDSAIELFEDPAGALGLAEVRQQPARAWVRPGALPVNMGYSRSVWWLRLTLRNASRTAPADKLLQLRSSLQDEMTLSVVQANGQAQTFPTTGDRVAFAARPIPATMPVFPIRLQPGATAQVFVRLATHDGLHEQLGVVAWQPMAYFANAESQALGFGAYYGLIGVLLIYSASAYFWTRRTTFSIYCGYLASVGLWSATYSGHSLRYVWPDSPVANNQVLPISMGCFVLFGLAYTTKLIQLQRLMPRCDWALTWLGRACLAATLPAAFGHYAAAFALSLPIGMLAGMVVAVCCVVLVKRGSRSAGWMLLGWSFLHTSGLLLGLEILGLIRPHPWVSSALFLGVALQVLFLGLGLGQAVDRSLREKVANEKAAREAQEQVAVELERQVKQRTLELERANGLLQELAITDALTGAYNRRHFNETLAAEVRRRSQGVEQPALCLIDIDHFKAYNDHYGHPKGDAVLRTVTELLRAGLRRAEERPFRVGGEEFAVILPPGDIDEQRSVVEQMRLAIERQAVPHAGSALGVVTASFGLVQFPPPALGQPGLRASALYKEADHMLYSAKAAGRNRVACAERAVAEWAPNSDLITLTGGFSAPTLSTPA